MSLYNFVDNLMKNMEIMLNFHIIVSLEHKPFKNLELNNIFRSRLFDFYY